MTPKPSDSMSERARELAEVATKQTLMGYGAGFSSTKIIEILTPIIASAITAERTAAFNEGAGGAYEDMVQVCLQPKKFTDVCTWKECAEIIRHLQEHHSKLRKALRDSMALPVLPSGSRREEFADTALSDLLASKK